MENKTKLEAYQDLQPLIQKEIETQFPKLYAQYAAKYGVADIPLHYHNGFDAPQISQENVVSKLRASGSISLATNGREYTLNLTGTPTHIQFYGNAIHRSGGTIDVRAQCVGSADLGPSYFFQPENTTTVSPSDIIGNVIQSGSYILVETTTPQVNASATEGHLLQVIYTGGIGTKLTGNIVAQITIPNAWTKGLNGAFDYSTKGYGIGYIYMDVDLATGWEINGNFVVT